METDVRERRATYLRRYDVTAAKHAHDLQALVDVAARLAGTAGAAIRLYTDAVSTDAHSSHALPCHALPTDAVPTEAGPFQVSTTALCPRSPGAVTCGSAQLVAPDGVVVGDLAVFDTVPRVLSPEQERALGFLADRTIDIFELRATSRDLESSLAALTRSGDELRRSNELLSVFAGQISHDLRSPLTAIMASAEALTREPTVAADPDLEPLARTALEAAHRMAVMIDQILAHALLGARLDRSAVDLDVLLGAVLTDLTPILRESGARVQPGDLPTVSGDAQQLYSVLLNLVTNAVKFARPGIPPQIRIAAERGEQRWRIMVTDNGIGIPPRHRDAVFDLFRRAAPSVDGQGIGLATVKRIVAAHGGAVGIDDSPDGAGGTVWFELPD